MNLKQIIKKYISNLPGWRTKRKLLVIESDDWGSIRMSTAKGREKLIEKGIVGETNRYNKYDTLATSDDLSSLYEVLKKYRDRKGNPAVLTPITITGNPDFKKIKDEDFEQYTAEPFTKTLARFYGEDNQVMETWKEGMDAGVFKPQFHGREHLNVAEWMRALRNGDKATLTAFDDGIWGFDISKTLDPRISSFQAAFDLYDREDLNSQSESIREGLQFFEDIFGYRATFFVPPNGPFNNSLEKTAAENGIQYISKAKIQLEPLGEGEIQKSYHRPGQVNESGLVCITRNCIFEPSEEGKDWVNSCLSDIKIAFRMRKPAVISTHRVNYIGALDKKNRTRGLKQLDELLSSVIKEWPDVEFITSDQLGDIMTGKDSHE